MKVVSGNYLVVESGSVIPFSSSSNVEFILELSPDFSFTVKIECEDNGGEREMKKEVDVEKNIIIYKCINFDLGAGTIEPLDLATVDGKKVFLHL